MSLRPAAALLVLSAVVAAPSLGSEGALELRDGDVVGGSLQRCGDVHLLEVQLGRRDVLRFTVDSPRPGSEPIHVRVTDPEGYDRGERARVRVSGGSVKVGPFRADVSGVWRVALSTSGEHDLLYEGHARIKRKRRQSVRVGRRGRTVEVAGGARLRLKAKRGVAGGVAITPPSGRRLELHPGDPQLDALLGDGLSAPRAGVYRIERLPGTKSIQLRVEHERSRRERHVRFPDLSEDRPEEALWVDGAGWVLTDREDAAPDGLPQADGPHAWTAPLPSAPTRAPVESAPRVDDVTAPAGPDAGVGLPVAGIPDLAYVLENGELVETDSGPEYRLTDEVPGIGPVERRVRFLVEGRPVRAPLELDGRLCIKWVSTSDEPFHRGDWALTLDSERELSVLDGSESWRDALHRTVTTTADGFSLRGAAAWPTGTLSWTLTDPRGTDLRRVETYPGTDHAQVEIQRDGTPSGSGSIRLW